jgi:hypothetical protein
MRNIFTHAECTDRKYQVHQAVTQAQSVLLHKYRVDELCTDRVRSFNRDDKITMKMFSNIVEALVDDTLYWKGM